jgi:hypothetical protein
MKKLHTKIYNNLMDRGIGVAMVHWDDEDLSNIQIYRCITQEENEEFKWYHNMYIMYGKGSINTRANVIDLRTGEIKTIWYTNIYPEFICRKMNKEYHKPYFDKFEDKVILRERYGRSVELWDWFENVYDGRYDYMSDRLTEAHVQKSKY